MSEVGIHLCILAAGASRRFGATKQLYPISGQPMVLHAYNCINHASVVSKSLVLGANIEDICGQIPSHINVIVSNDWQLGLSASIGAAVEAMRDDTSHLMLALADQISIQSGDFQRLINACLKYPDSVIASTYAGNRGVPAIFPRAYAKKLMNLTGDKGASHLLGAMESLIEVYIPQALIDIDSPDDLQKLKNTKQC